jgi:hypothetical protein
MSVDDSALGDLQDVFRSAAFGVVPATRQVVTRGALNVKQGMAADAEAAAPVHAPHFPRSISYDVETSGAVVEAEVGPDKDRQGAQGGLGNILAFGTRNNAPVWDHAAALEREAPALDRFVGEAAERLLS